MDISTWREVFKERYSSYSITLIDLDWGSCLYEGGFEGISEFDEWYVDGVIVDIYKKTVRINIYEENSWE